MCRTCNGYGVLRQKQYWKRYAFMWRQQKKQRPIEPYAKLKRCPDCNAEDS